MNIMLDILGAALVVFVFLGYVRRVRLREPVRAPRPWGPVPERRVRDAVRKRRHIHARREPKRRRTAMTKAPSRTRRRPSPLIWREARALPRSRILGVLGFASLGARDRPDARDGPDHDGHGGAEGQAWGTRLEDRDQRLVVDDSDGATAGAASIAKARMRESWLPEAAAH